MKNYKIYTIALLILGFTACSSMHDEVSNCATDGSGSGCKQFNPIRPCTKEYMPVCGEVQIECVTTPCNPIMKTFSNACVLANNKRARFLYNGACR